MKFDKPDRAQENVQKKARKVTSLIQYLDIMKNQ
jgi:hypothetical protein